MTEGDVLFRREAALGRMTLNRPKALNALTHNMCAEMLDQILEWQDDPAIQAVLIDAMPGRAFCAGGDIRAIHGAAKARDGKAAEFFITEYRLNSTIKNYPKPYIALIDGMAFGGGLGVSVHGSDRVVSENALAGMPETGIGLFPDIGASYFLNRCPGQLGMYLALTGERLKAADLIYTRLATTFIPSVRFADIPIRLAQGETPSAVFAALAGATASAPLAQHRDAIDRAFGARSVEAIVEALKDEGQWGQKTAAHLLTLSPLSLKLTFRQIREGAHLDFASCQCMEYRLATRMVESHDFNEGVRAAVIDKDQKPIWHPKRLEDVTDEEVNRYFAPLDSGDLVL